MFKKIIRKLQGKTYPYNSQQNELRKFVVNTYPEENKLSKKVDISMLTLNRIEDTKRTLESLYQTTLPFNLILIDQKSDDGTREFVQEFYKLHDNVELVLLDENLGVSGGRAKAVEYAKTDYLAFIDNDMVFMPGYFENLLTQLETSEKLAGVCGKSVMPNEKIEVNHPVFEIKDDWIVFKDEDSGKKYDESTTLKASDCPWIPMGVSMWRTEVLKKVPIDAELIGAYEDNEYTYRLNKLGYKFKNCPSAVVLHIKAEFTKAMNDKNYTQGRFNNEKLQFAVKHFYQKHKLYLAFGDIEESCKFLGFSTPQDLKDFVKN